MYNDNILIKIRRLALIHYYYRILKPHSSFAKCPQFPWRKRIQVRINHVLPLFVMSFGLECALSFSVIHNLEAVDEKRGSMKTSQGDLSINL